MKKMLIYLPAVIGMLMSKILAVVITLVSTSYHIAFSPVYASNKQRSRTGGCETIERQSQTGRGVWAFITNLFAIEGRTYTWQAGPVS